MVVVLGRWASSVTSCSRAVAAMATHTPLRPRLKTCAANYGRGSAQQLFVHLELIIVVLLGSLRALNSTTEVCAACKTNSSKRYVLLACSLARVHAACKQRHPANGAAHLEATAVAVRAAVGGNGLDQRRLCDGCLGGDSRQAISGVRAQFQYKQRELAV